MALTVNNFTGFETQGAEESVAVQNSPAYLTSDPAPGGSVAYLSLDASDAYDLPWVADGVTDAGNDYVVGFKIKATDKTANSVPTFLDIVDSAGGSILRLRMSLSGNVVIHDANGSIIQTISDPLSQTDYQLWELYFQHSDPGTVELFIDGVSKGEQTSQDLTDGNSLNSSAVLRFDTPTDTLSALLFDDAYILSGASSASDRLGGCEIFAYQAGNTGTTPDRQVGGTGGTTLDAGTWDKAGETPGASTATNPEYVNAGDGAVDCDDITGRKGPSGQSEIDGDSNIKAIKGIWTMQRSGGGGTDHFGLLGNTGDHVFRSADLDPTQSFANYFFLSEGTPVPLSTEFCSVGFETTGAQDFECQEMWAMLLHVPDVAAGGGRLLLISPPSLYGGMGGSF